MSPKIDPPSEAAPAPGGAYEVLRQRLVTQAAQLRDQAAQLDGERRTVFGDSSLEVIGRLNVRTENNCVARDLVQVGELLLFGYNVFIGLKKETRIEDVFALYRLNAVDGGFEAEPVPIAGSFLDQPGFVQDFRELYTYYKHTRLLQLIRRETLLLAVFQLSERPDDIRVFRWDIGAGDREIRYRDNRGERDIVLPPAFDFTWTSTGRDDVVAGRHPHLNILDTVFVETINGDLTVKIENNTEDGLGIYREPVSDQTQSIDDASIEYARVGSLILLRVTPYKEPAARHLVYNTLTRQVQRLDAIANACVQLPEDHGIVFPGGCVLQNGDTRLFDQDMDGMRFRRMIRSPNGEDVLYVFYQPETGAFALFVYNLILRQLRSPLLAHGYARYDDGRIVLFSAESEEPTRVHAMQVWRTPFCSDEFAAASPSQGGWIAKLGNAEIVRALSTLHSLAREAESDQVSSARYARLVDEARRLFDHHHWIGQAPMQTLAGVLRELIATGEGVLGEFAKVEGLQRAAERSLAETRTRFEAVRAKARPDRFEKIEDFVAALAEVDALRGHVLNVREQRYVDVSACDGMRKTLDELSTTLGAATFDYLGSSTALAPLRAQVSSLEQAGLAATSAREGKAGIEACRSLAVELDVLSSVIANLQTDDAPRQTRIVGEVGEIYAALNQARARIGRHVESLGGEEATAQFAAQFQLFAQAVQHALGAANDPERCDAELSRILVQLEEIESRFGEHERFTQALLDKREEVLEAFESHRQSLVDARQRKAAHLHEAAARILDGLPRRTARITEADALQSFFVSDPLILKLRELVERLRALGDAVKADDIEARVKAARDQAIRAQRDAAELFEDGGDTIKLGPRHRFSVNRQELDLTALPRGDTLCLHLIGTDFFEPIDDAELQALRPYWEQGLESESADLARAEYLAQRFLDAAEAGHEGLSIEALRRARLEPAGLEPLLRRFAEPRYREGYERGIHDHDAARIAAALLDLRAAAGLLRHDPAARGWAALAWRTLKDTVEAKRWPDRARAAAALRRSTGSTRAAEKLVDDLSIALRAWAAAQALPEDAARCRRAAVFLAEWLAQPHPHGVVSRDAAALIEHARERLDSDHAWQALTLACGQTEQPLAERLALAEHGLEAVLEDSDGRRFYVPEAAALLVQGQDSVPKAEAVDLAVEVGGLLSQHPRIVDGRMQLAVDAFSLRWQAHTEQFLPQLQRMHALRHAFLQDARRRMRLAEFKPRPLTSFVRNRLINEVYLGVVADNLAKQIGAAGATKRSDLMGLLMLISPPGYGKTTLMEYVADRLGLVFMKINGPALGHEVRALDPARAPDATSRQELEKLNLALEMGNNVMLYVDDIQHTHPEFLQKFISLCDGSRRIEGVWRGETRTYDLRGKKFCVVMAGNPYTESGEVFRIPDMLANRADVYNLGEVVGGREDLFLLSYLENALTSNPALAPLATRPMTDVYALIERAQGKPVSLESLSHGYSQAEIDEIVTTFERLITARDVVYRVNQQYIASAAQDDAYRTEPAFKLQGSYRNMAKLAEKIRGVMNAAELNRLIDDHYLGEAQLLTTGAEENLLKLAELRDCLDEERAARWAEIKRTYARNRSLGGAESDTGTRLVAQLGHLVESVRDLRAPLSTEGAPTDEPPWWPQLRELLERLASEQTLARTFSRDSATDSAMWLGGLRNALELGFRPLVDGMKLRSDQHAELNKLIKALIAEQRRGKAKPAD